MNAGKDFVPGMMKCQKCGFILTKSLLFAPTGNVTANPNPTIEACPNDNELMVGVTWRERCADLVVVCESQIQRAVKAEALTAAQAVVLENVDKALELCDGDLVVGTGAFESIWNERIAAVKAARIHIAAVKKN